MYILSTFTTKNNHSFPLIRCVKGSGTIDSIKRMVLTRFIDKIHSCLQHKVREQNGECFLKTILACRNCQRSAEHGLESIGATAAALLTHLRNIHCNLHLWIETPAKLQEIEEAAMKTCRRRDDSRRTRAPSMRFRSGKSTSEAFNLGRRLMWESDERAAVDLPWSGGRGCGLDALPFVFRDVWELGAPIKLQRRSAWRRRWVRGATAG